jgi:pyruvate dehydrogenase E1 component beta subunit
LYGLEAYVPEEPFTVPFGKARITRPGSDITIVGISNMQVEALRAHELLNEIGIEAEVIDPITLVPLDIDVIVDSVRRTGNLLVVDNAWTSCGASAEIVSQVVEAISPLGGVRVKRLGFAPTTCPTTPTLEALFYPNPATIAAAAHTMLRPNATPWSPDPERCRMAHNVNFKGPF